MQNNEKNSNTKKPNGIKKFLWSVVNPGSDLKFIYNKGLMPLLDSVKILSRLKPSDRPVELLTFEQAVNRSGRTAAELRKAYKDRQQVWSILMYFFGITSTALAGMMLIATDVPIVTMTRAFTWLIVMMGISFYSYTQVLTAVYRHWQVVGGKVSIEEGGTFQDFTKEVRPVLDILLFKYQNSKW